MLLERFLREVGSGLAQILAGETAPLVLAGVDCVQDRFRRLSSYPQVLDGGISGNPEQLSMNQLHARAWPIVQQVIASALHDAAERYLRGTGNGAVSSVSDVVPAAAQGRVAVLFVPTGQQCWGEVDPQTLRVTVHPDRRAGDEGAGAWAGGRASALLSSRDRRAAGRGGRPIGWSVPQQVLR